MAEYIERDAALNYQNEVEPCLCRNAHTGEVFSATRDDALVRYLEQIPAADVRPVVRGKWIWKDNGEVVCSECNDLIAVVGNTEDLETVVSGFNFCPNCGADMREET